MKTSTHTSPRVLALDWGTSSLRGALMDAHGQVLKTASEPRGIATVPAGGFADVFDAIFGSWIDPLSDFCIISGMAGSRQGWKEAPYCPCPATRDDLAANMIQIEARRIALVPGVSRMPVTLRDDRAPDVMRGEEVQVFGALALLGHRDGLFVLPGTHSKWVRVQDGSIVEFRTFMTGEMFALLAQHSLLSHNVEVQAPLSETAFLRGLVQADNACGLLHNAFGVRTRSLFAQLDRDSAASYLSGVLIGEELRAQGVHGSNETVTLVGEPSLLERYALALRRLGVAHRTLGQEATWSGLHALAQQHLGNLKQ